MNEVCLGRQKSGKITVVALEVALLGPSHKLSKGRSSRKGTRVGLTGSSLYLCIIGILKLLRVDLQQLALFA